ncbi:MAG: hypothetical protein A49_15490 [Methyloceanibacter sp.]|nr:MAG: hypothetical protein A49_15490 [Methyloceanibacter sp.]
MALADPLSTVFLDGHRVFRGVAPIVSLDLTGKACGDVRVLICLRDLTCLRERGSADGAAIGPII